MVKKAYLWTILDSATNEVLTYNLSKSLKIDIVTDTIIKLMNRKPFLNKDSFRSRRSLYKSNFSKAI